MKIRNNFTAVRKADTRVSDSNRKSRRYQSTSIHDVEIRKTLPPYSNLNDFRYNLWFVKIVKMSRTVWIRRKTSTEHRLMATDNFFKMTWNNWKCCLNWQKIVWTLIDERYAKMSIICRQNYSYNERRWRQMSFERYFSPKQKSATAKCAAANNSKTLWI